MSDSRMPIANWQQCRCQLVLGSAADITKNTSLFTRFADGYKVCRRKVKDLWHTAQANCDFQDSTSSEFAVDSIEGLLLVCSLASL